jgi:cytochrome c5
MPIARRVRFLLLSVLLAAAACSGEAPPPSAPAQSAPPSSAQPPAAAETEVAAAPPVVESASAESAPPPVVESASAEPVTPPVAESAPVEPVLPPVSIDGGELYNNICAVCHRAGLNAAPKYGDKFRWAKVVAKGRAELYKNSVVGIRAMPPRGGMAALSDDEVHAAVEYMVNGSGGWGSH